MARAGAALTFIERSPRRTRRSCYIRCGKLTGGPHCIPIIGICVTAKPGGGVKSSTNLMGITVEIYLLEDSPCEAAYFVNCLEDRGHRVSHFECATELFHTLSKHRPNLLVLDWKLAGVSGFDVLIRVRELFGPSLPAMMMTCEDSADRIVDALRSGADDYLVKPMTRQVLVARIEALMRRASAASTAPLQVLQRGAYRLDYRRQEITADGAPINLTPKEFDLAWALFSYPDGFIPKNDLICCVWGKRAEIATHTFTQHVYVVRKKLRLQDHGFSLVAVYGSGYRLVSPPQPLAVPAGPGWPVLTPPARERAAIAVSAG
jgi:DNA-binding response OmpR family regulator